MSYYGNPQSNPNGPNNYYNQQNYNPYGQPSPYYQQTPYNNNLYPPNPSNPFAESLLNHQETAPSKASDLYGAARTSFIRKVYTILAAQILVTVLMTGLSMSSTSFFRFQIENVMFFYMVMITAIVCQVWIFCCNGGRKYPQNIILTSVFTLCESYIVSFISSATGMQSGNSLVFIAAFMTLAVVSACTLYALHTKQDYTTSSALVVVLAVVLMCLFIVMLFTDSPFIQMLYCSVGVLLFGIYIVIDTQMIVGGKTVELEIDDYYLGAMLLYVDIISIFLYILQMLGLVSGGSEE